MAAYLRRGLDVSSIQEILAREAREAGMRPAHLLEHDRRPHMLAVRFRVYWLMRQTGASYPQIGKLMNRTHATIMSGVKRYERDYRSGYNRGAGNDPGVNQ